MQSNGEQQERRVHRSPNYPGLSLPEAIERLKVVYQREKRTYTTARVLAQDLELTPASGPANRIVSALRQYGLLEQNDKGQLGISDLGFRVIHLSDSPERDDLIKEAARKPTIISEVLRNYPDGLPPSDTSIKDFLIDAKNFNPESVEFFVKMFRKTVAFAKLDGSEHNDEPEDVFPKVEAVSRMEGQQEKVEERSAAQAPSSDVPYFRFTLKGATVEFRASAPLAKEHFELIKAHLKAYEPSDCE